MRTRSARSAFTLVEVIVAGVISAVILASVTSITVNTIVEGAAHPRAG